MDTCIAWPKDGYMFIYVYRYAMHFNLYDITHLQHQVCVRICNLVYRSVTCIWIFKHTTVFITNQRYVFYRDNLSIQSPLRPSLLLFRILNVEYYHRRARLCNSKTVNEAFLTKMQPAPKTLVLSHIQLQFTFVD